MAAVDVGPEAVQRVDKDVVIRRIQYQEKIVYVLVSIFQITSLMILARFIIDLLKISYKRVNA